MLDKYPLSDLEKKIFLNGELLKVMLSSSSGGKQFGECLANMCRDNLKLSKKVSKVFIKSINQSNYDNIKSYLTALKPFVKMEDSLKQQRLEWIFGISQIVARKGYQQERHKYGLEFVDRIGEESYTYVSPISGSQSSDDPLLAQLMKCKGKLDTFAINCLKDMLSIMAKDEKIARYVYSQAAPTYQGARYTDWIRPYLEYQKTEVERTNSYAYFKAKHDAILKALDYLHLFEERWVSIYKQEEIEALDKAKEDETFTTDVQKDYLAYQHEEVIPHFPPHLIIGKQTQDEVEFLVYDEDPLVKVVISEVTCEYNYSNPTIYFNLSLPHIELKTNAYTCLSYAQMKQSQFDMMKKERDEAAAAATATANASATEETANSSPKTEDAPQEEPEKKETKNENPVEEDAVPALVEEGPSINTRNWFQFKREGSVMLRVSVTNKSAGKLKFRVKIEPVDADTSNVRVPESAVKDLFYRAADVKTILHLQKIHQHLPWTPLKVSVEAISKEAPVVTTAG